MHTLHRPLATFALLAGSVYAAALLIAATPMLAQAPRLLSGLITVDLLVCVPLFYWLLVVSRTRVPAFTVVPVVLAGAAAAWLILPERHHAWLALGALAAPAVAEAAVLVIAAVRARRLVPRVRSAPAGADRMDVFRDALRETIGIRPVADAIASEIALVWYALFSWRARARVETGAVAFTNDRRTGAAGVLFGLGLASVMEVPVVHVLLARESAALAWVVTFASAYQLLWILGFARALRLHPVVLGPDSVRLRVGLIWDVTVPYASIAAVEDAPRRPLDRDAPGYLHAAFVGTPQTVLALAEPVEAQGIYGWRKRGVRRIGVYVDEPAPFAAELRRRAGRIEDASDGLAGVEPTPVESPLEAARRAGRERLRAAERTGPAAGDEREDASRRPGAEND